MSNIPIVGGIHTHYKGNQYQVLGTAHHSETLEELVVYRGKGRDEAFGKNPIWVRPKDMFLQEVTWDGTKVPRFKFTGEVKDVETATP